MPNKSAAHGGTYLPFTQQTRTLCTVIITLMLYMCAPAIASDLDVTTSEGCIPVLSQVPPDGFKELDSVDFSGDERLYPSTRIFFRNVSNREIRIVVRVAEAVEQLRCDFTIIAVASKEERVRIKEYNSRPFGWLNETDKFERRALKDFIRECEKVRKVNPALSDMPVFFVDRSSGQMTSLTHGGGCTELARSTAVGFLVATKRHSIAIKLVGLSIKIGE